MLKIGFQNFNNWLETDYCFLKAFRDKGIIYIVVDPTIDRADIVFKCGEKSGQKLQGNPFIIGYTDSVVYRVEDANLSLSFYSDSEANLYYPTWQTKYGLHSDKPSVKNHEEKNLFCSFIERYDSEKRDSTFLDICLRYKPIISCGLKWSNSGYCFDENKDYKYIKECHRRVKFNLCFEDYETNGNLWYLTDKIIRAYEYGVVPIYCGSHNITNWFNPESFINCNGLTNDEILEKIMDIDTNDELYKHMLYSNPFNENIEWKIYSEQRLINFLENKGVI